MVLKEEGICDTISDGMGYNIPFQFLPDQMGSV